MVCMCNHSQQVYVYIFSHLYPKIGAALANLMTPFTNMDFL